MPRAIRACRGRCGCWRWRWRRTPSRRFDLVPDVIPVLGLLDDLLLIPLGVALVVKFTPAHVLVDARQRAEATADKPVSRVAAVVIALVWIALLALAWWCWRR